MHRIVFLHRSTIQANIRLPAFPHGWEEYANTPPDYVVARLAGATIAITNKVPLRREALVQLPQVKMIAVCATGTDKLGGYR